MKISVTKKGFTLPELLISLAILGVLFSISTIALLRSQRSFSQAAFIDSLLTDFREQQTKAMSQDTQGAVENNDFGIYLGSDSYTLFRGSSYVQNDPENFVVNIDSSLSIVNIDLPSSSIIFESGSGEFVGFVEGNNSFSVQDSTNNEVFPITLNRYGIPLE